MRACIHTVNTRVPLVYNTVETWRAAVWARRWGGGGGVPYLEDVAVNVEAVLADGTRDVLAKGSAPVSHDVARDVLLHADVARHLGAGGAGLADELGADLVEHGEVVEVVKDGECAGEWDR